MTHDKLLASIIDYGQNGPIDYGQIDLSKALRAVVELHKPVEEGNGYFTCNRCVGIISENRVAMYHSYPCPTIQAIEKELK